MIHLLVDLAPAFMPFIGIMMTLQVTMVALAAGSLVCSHAGENMSRSRHLIITSSRLKPAFEDLAKYRASQGMPSEVVTVEDISKSFRGRDLPEKIRICIGDWYSNRLVRFVAIGGDDTVVPPRYCSPKGEAMPTDLYYSDVDGGSWDKNHDGEFGRREDITIESLTPEICLGRIPVRQPNKVRDYIAKIRRYEACRDPRFIKSLLITSQGGLPQDDSVEERPGESQPPPDFAVGNEKTRDIYFKHIEPVWKASKLDFFFVLPDYRGGLLERWNRGYNFVIRMGHGNGFGWSGFCVADAFKLRNPIPSIVWSGGCGNGKYDASKDPTFSEALIRNPNGGAVAVFGHSRAVSGDVNNTAFWHSMFASENATAGEVYVDVLRSVAGKWVRNPGGAYNFSCLCDPALRIHR